MNIIITIRTSININFFGWYLISFHAIFIFLLLFQMVLSSIRVLYDLNMTLYWE